MPGEDDPASMELFLVGVVNKLLVDWLRSSRLPDRSSCARECRMATKLLRLG